MQGSASEGEYAGPLRIVAVKRAALAERMRKGTACQPFAMVSLCV